MIFGKLHTDLVLQFFGGSREKTPFTLLHAPPSSPASTPSPAEGQIGSLSFSQRCSHSVAPPKASGRGGAPVPGGAHPSARPTWPCRARRCSVRRGPGPAPRLQRTPRLGGVSDSAGSAADPILGPTKAHHPLLSSYLPPPRGPLVTTAKRPVQKESRERLSSP